MTKKTLIIILFVVIVAVCIFLGYEIYHTREGGISHLSKVSLRLKWLDQAQFAGFYLADSHGLYSKRGMEVEINPGGPDISPVQMVTTGVNDFGITGGDQIILAREKGVPLVALAVFYKDSPVVIISLKEDDITTPKDFEGRKVGVVYGRDEEVIYRALLKEGDVNTKRIEEVPCLFNASQLMSGEIDAQVGYETNEVVLLRKAGFEVNVIRPKDYGIDFYADTLFTTEEMIKKSPELVRGFVQASVEGWRLALDNPKIALDEIIKVNPLLDEDHQSKFLEYSAPMIIGKGEIGFSEKVVWEEMQETLLSQGILKSGVDIDKVFTNKFLK